MAFDVLLVPVQVPPPAFPLQAFSILHVSLASLAGSASVPAPTWPLVTSDLMTCGCTWNCPLCLLFSSPLVFRSGFAFPEMANGGGEGVPCKRLGPLTLVSLFTSYCTDAQCRVSAKND